jgi:hypothetical protein
MPLQDRIGYLQAETSPQAVRGNRAAGKRATPSQDEVWNVGQGDAPPCRVGVSACSRIIRQAFPGSKSARA